MCCSNQVHQILLCSTFTLRVEAAFAKLFSWPIFPATHKRYHPKEDKGQVPPQKRETLNTPIELCPGTHFLVFSHIFLGPAWFCIKPRSIVLHFLFCNKDLAMFFYLTIILMFLAAAQWIRNLKIFHV